MELTFLGRGNGFAETHTSAYFVTDPDEQNEYGKLVIIDCSAMSLQRLKQLPLQHYRGIYVHITHMHADHSSGLSLLVQYLFFECDQKRLTIIAPSDEVESEIQHKLLTEGCSPNWYILTTVKQFDCKWLIKTIPTKHTSQLEGKCFGYVFNINNRTIIYTGDTNTLEPFENYGIQNCDELYVDISINKTPAHLHIDAAFEKLVSFAEAGIEVYFMHLDDVVMAENLLLHIRNMGVVPI